MRILTRLQKLYMLILIFLLEKKIVLETLKPKILFNIANIMFIQMLIKLLKLIFVKVIHPN